MRITNALEQTFGRSVARAVVIGSAVVVGCTPTDREESTQGYSAEIAALAEEAWQYDLARYQYLQVRSGELIRELSDYTPEDAAERVAFARSMLERLDRIPLDALDHEDAITAGILRWDNEMTLDLEPHYWLSFPYAPYTIGMEFNFIHDQVSVHPFSDVEFHSENYLTVLSEYADFIEQIRAHIQGQMERGIYMSKHAVPGVVGMFESFRASVPQVFEVSGGRLDAFSDEQRTVFLEQVKSAIQDDVLPAYDALLASLQSDEYRDNAPDAVGLAQYPNGEAYYRALVKFHTTEDITPEELHELGKLRVTELEAEMAAIRDEVGFSGTKEEFHLRLRTDPQFFAESPEQVEARFNQYIARIEPRISEYFRTLPQAPYGVKRLEPETEATMTFGYYQPPTPDEPVGYYRYNGSKLDERPQIESGALIYHELVPGHHFHIALQSENESLPKYRREYFAATAFNEGWGNYAAFLALEMGLLDDVYDRYGTALFDMFISVRLVVDTGMNLLGWTLEEARDYMREHTFSSETEIASETLRYSTDLFGQALAYKSGVERMLELRRTVEARTGDSFDIRDFHDAMLGSGAMPLAVLERHIDWFFN